MGEPSYPASKAGAVPLAMRRALQLAALALGLAGEASAACSQPEQLAVLKGEQAFVQTRTLKGMSKPLVSQGVVKPAGDGVLWTVEKPVKIVTRINPNGVTQSIEDGPEAPAGPAAGANPFIADTGLLDLLKGDLSKLPAHYDVRRSVRVKPEGFRLEMTPKASSLSPYITGISIEGCQRIEAITVAQANGDTLRIDFKDKT